MAKKIRPFVLLLGLASLFLAMFALYGPGIYNDSDQYITMHIHREPLYPLFLAALRGIFGDNYLVAAGIVQNLLAAGSLWLTAEYLYKKFSLYVWEELVITCFLLMPYFITRYCSSLHIFVTSSIMSEALCFPLFTLFLLECFRIFAEGRRGAVCRALLLALALSLIRTQMLITILLWLTAVICRAFVSYAESKRALVNRVPAQDGRRERKMLWMKLAVALAATLLVFVGRQLAVKSYNLVFNGRFINNTYGTVNILTNILYAADREDGVHIEGDEAREFFYRMYDLTEERQANYKYAGGSLREKAEHIEKWHDTIKFEMIEDVFYQTYDKNVTSDYITQNLMADETAGEIIKGILPHCLGRWLFDYFLIVRYGLVRSIGVVHPVINWVVLLLYLSAVLLSVTVAVESRREKKMPPPAFWLMATALLGIFANTAVVGITIMALSRYMIYGFSMFYIAYFMLLLTLLRMHCVRNIWKILI